MKTDVQTDANSVPLDDGHPLRAMVTLERLFRRKKRHVDRDRVLVSGAET
jgi:hypothetical protein